MKVIKRNGIVEDIDFNKIKHRIQHGLDYLKYNQFDISAIDGDTLAKEAISKLTDYVTAAQMDEYICILCADKVTYDPAYMYLAGYIAHTSLIKNTYTLLGVDNPVTGLLKLCELGLVSQDFLTKVKQFSSEVFAHELAELGTPLTYFAVKTFERTYLLKKDHTIVETPAMCRLRTAINLTETTDEALKVYADLMKHKYTTATPILMNSGKQLQNLASCYLFNNESDSFIGIQNTFNEAMNVSRLAGGVGIHLHNIRAKGTEIRSAGEPAAGMVPLLRQYVAGLRTWNQAGKRMGSAAVYLEPWHADIRDFLNAANPHSPVSVRVDELFYALWVPDLFMKQVQEDGDWYLFCPTKLERAGFPALQTLWGEEFEAVYWKAVEASAYNEKVKARDIWTLMIETQMTSGKPYVCFKDNANRNNPQALLGTLQGSNLCSEIMEYTSDTHTAVCNLGSISAHQNLSQEELVSRDNLYAQLYKSSWRLAELLNKAIDVTTYVSDKMSTSNLMMRPIAIGVQGMAELLIKLGLSYDSDEAMLVQGKVIEAIYNGAYDQGITNKCGNTLHVALMPTASTAQILNNTESFEPLSGIVYKRNTNSGEFTVLQPSLITGLKEAGLWSEDMRKTLLANPDSIQELSYIPEHIRLTHKTVWDVPLNKHIEASIHRQKWVDQSQSLNLYMAEINSNELSKALFQGWRGGLKTGLYYLRTKSAGKKRNITT